MLGIQMTALQWKIAPGTVYLNHGSFGPPLTQVRDRQLELQQKCNEQPMDFFVRQLEPLWYAARSKLAQFVSCDPENLIFSQSATASMNHIAHFFPLRAGDEVLLNNHEYGVVKQIWKRKCDETGAVYREIKVELPLEDSESLVDRFETEIRETTKLIVISHITSPTAITFPIDRLVGLAKSRGVPVCVDGPHAPVQVPIDLRGLDCDFYVASCHKWLCAPFGSGFTYVSPKWQAFESPLALSWGRLPPGKLEHWTHHHLWTGTCDYSSNLTIPVAIDAFESYGLDRLRERNHRLARYARERLIESLGTKALIPDDPSWYSMMAAVWLPRGDHSSLQAKLWNLYGIEVPIVSFDDRYLVRVSCHLYNDESHIDLLIEALTRLSKTS